MVEVNYLALIVVAITNMVIGTIWYGPLFGKQWVSMMGFSPEKIAEAKAKGMKGMWKTYLIAFVSSFVMAFVLWQVIVYKSGFLQESGAMLGAKTGFWLWLGLVVPVTLSSVLWEGRSWKLWILNSAYYLVFLKIAGVMLAVWMS